MQFKFASLFVFVFAAVTVQAAPVSKAAITITATGATSVPAKPDGCAHITPAGQNAQNVCAKSVTASGFKLTVTDLTTGAKTNCNVAGTSGTCGTTGAGATIGAASADPAATATDAATAVAAAPAKASKAKKGGKGKKAKKGKKSAKGGAAVATAASAVTITAPGVTGVVAKPDGCAHITPAGANAQNVCAKSITASGFNLSVTDLTTGAKSNCKVTGTSGTCGTTGAGATVSAPAKRDIDEDSEEDIEERATQVPAGVDITITAGSKNVGANHFGCADITPAGEDSQLVCTSEFTSTGFKLSVKDNHTGVRSTCDITGTTGTCGPSGAGAKLSSLPKREFEEDLEERATQVPAGVDITITAGSKAVGANHFGCADITPAGEDSQLVCTSEFTSTGFKLSVKDNHTGVRSTCDITGTTGTCGPSGAGAKLSSLPKREFEDVDERED